MPPTTSSDSLSSRTLYMGIAMGLLGAIGFSGKAIVVKLAFRYGVDAVTLLMYRMLFALPIFLAISWVAGRGKPPLTRKDWLSVIWLGFTGYYAASYLDFAGLAYITASLERLILFLNPTLVVILSWILYRKRITVGQALAMLLSYAGALLVFVTELSLQGSNVVWGSFLVLLSAISYAIYLTYSGQVVQRLGSLRLVGLATTVACFFCIAQFALLRPLDDALNVAPQVIGLSIFNAIFCTALPVLMVMMSIERIGSGMAAQIGMIGPISTILLGVWLLDEPFTFFIAIGTVLVISGTYLFTRLRQRPAAVLTSAAAASSSTPTKQP